MTVQTWRKSSLEADSMLIAIPENGYSIRIEFCAADKNTFAHGHLDLEMAMMLNQQLLLAIEQLKRRAN